MRSRAILAGLSLAILAARAWANHEAGAELPATEPVAIGQGRITGVALGPGRDVVAFKGIPYAAPPVGRLRWRPPGLAPCWDGVRACTRFGPACPQPQLPGFSPPGPTSEDCLTLNVWAPAAGGGPGPGRPVMVWVHGGGFILGSGALPFYDGEALARRGVVVVTFNYRLGPFGFLAHPALARESDRGVSGNYGLLDQVAALRWVRANIAAFGGDSGRVTIFGESAGGISVCLLMIAPPARGLFHRAIVQSGAAYFPTPHLREPNAGMAPAEALGVRMARALGCAGAADPAAALRAKGAVEILAVAGHSLKKVLRLDEDADLGGTTFGPAVDGWVLPGDPGALLDAGRHRGVPLLIGSNADEMELFRDQLGGRDREAYRRYVGMLFPGHVEEALALFPAATDAEVTAAMSRIGTVALFTGPARRLARATARAGSPAFLYHFRRVPAAPWSRRLGAFHALEIPYVFGTLFDHPGAFTLLLGPVAFGAPDRSLSEAMMGSWTRFAATGDPNGPGLPRWREYDPSDDNYLEFGLEIRPGRGVARAACDLLDRAWPAVPATPPRETD